MESFIQEYLTSNCEDVNEEVLLERRISPYATLRPGDLDTLIKLQSLPVSSKFGLSHVTGIDQHPKLEAIIEKEQLGLSSEESSDDERGEEEGVPLHLVCRGADQGHVPAEYKVAGLKRHEMPVIGVFVDKRISPGFRYHVRRLGSNNWFWNNQARTLESIGMGYGRRLTFSGETLNNNECYFWSDSDPNGFAFSIQAVEVGQKFLIQDKEGNVVGEATVQKIHEPQVEISTKAQKAVVTKRVQVAVTCQVTYYIRHHHGLVDLVSHNIVETISGEAVLSKPRSSRSAILKAMEKVYLTRLGQCTLVPDC